MLHGPGATKRHSNMSYPTNSHKQVAQQQAANTLQGDYDFTPVESVNPPGHPF